MALANPLMNLSLVEGVKCVVFDCDGVLIDSIEANRHYYSNVKEQLGLPPLTEEELHYVHMHTHKSAIEHIIPAELFDKAWEVVKQCDSTTFAHHLTRSDGVREFLSWLRSAGFLLAVNTSRGDTVDFILQLMDLEGFFHPVITSSIVRVPKPHPEGMHIIMREHGLQPQDIAYIGDSRVDEQTGKASGVRFWAYKDQNLDAEVHIESFWEIKAAMERCYKGTTSLY